MSIGVPPWNVQQLPFAGEAYLLSFLTKPLFFKYANIFAPYFHNYMAIFLKYSKNTLKPYLFHNTFWWQFKTIRKS